MTEANDEKRSMALERLYNEISTAGVASNLVKRGDEGNDFDILVCKHSELGGDEPVMGQYFFPDFDGPDEVCYFTAMLTVKTKLTPDERSLLIPRAEEVNEQLVCGHFAVYPEIGLVYKITVPLSEELDDDDFYDQINITAAHAMTLTGSFRGMFE
jgi:hypothetical protein